MLDLFRQDVQRRIVPQQRADRSQVSFGTTIKCLWHHLPLQATFLFRIGSWLRLKHLPGLPVLLQHLILVLYGLDIVVGKEIAGGFYIAHSAGTAISSTRIGNNCGIIASVTVGMRNKRAVAYDCSVTEIP